MSPFERWVYALKLASWPKALVPALLGQAVGVAATGEFLVPAAAVAGAFTVAHLVALVLLNDYGDREVDALKRRMFPEGCSKKTIPDGILPGAVVRRAGIAAAIAALAIAAVGSWWLERPHLVWFGAGAVALLHAYTFWPLRLNYRGGGEALETLGVGLLLPWMHAYAQGGALLACGSVTFGGYFILSFASAVASGLADEASDREGGKTTIVTMVGNEKARALVEGALVFGGLSWCAAAWVDPQALPAGVAVVGIVPLAVFTRRAWRASASAVSSAFEAQALYKQHIHRAIWYSGVAMAAGILSRFAVVR